MDLAGYLSVLRRRLIPLLLTIVVGISGGYYKGHHTPSVYQTTSRVLVSQASGLSTVDNQLAGAALSTQFVSTYAQIATSRSVAQKVVVSLALGESADAVRGQLSSRVEPLTYLIDITATDGDPARARSLADTAAVALGERVDELERGKPVRVQAQLLDRAALPSVPTSPKPKSDLLLGMMLGVVMGLGVIALLEALDRTIKTTQQGDAAFASPLLALIPRRRARSLLTVPGDTSSVEGEPYRALRTAVQFTQPDLPLRTILVTSASPGDGKTTTAANLAVALAAAGETVVIVDADLRRATLGGLFGIVDSVGVTSLLLRAATLDECLQEWNGVFVLPSGRPLPPNPSEILGSHFMSDLLESLTERFDIVIIDTPPVLPVTDAVALATQVDAVLLVGRHSATQRGPAAEAHRRLESVGANVIGYVLNAVPARESAGYYASYRYEYAHRRPLGRGFRGANKSPVSQERE